MLEQPGAGELRVGSGSFSYVDVLVKPKVKATVRKVLRGDPNFVGCDCNQAPPSSGAHRAAGISQYLSIALLVSCSLKNARATRHDGGSARAVPLTVQRHSPATAIQIGSHFFHCVGMIVNWLRPMTSCMR